MSAKKYLNPFEVDLLVNAVNYKPGWIFSTFMHPFEGLCLRVELSVPNAYCRAGAGSEEQDQGLNIPVPPIVSVEHFHDWLKWRLGRFELHELNEFYWVNGEIVYDPHSQEYWDLRV